MLQLSTCLFSPHFSSPKRKSVRLTAFQWFSYSYEFKCRLADSNVATKAKIGRCPEAFDVPPAFMSQISQRADSSAESVRRGGLPRWRLPIRCFPSTANLEGLPSRQNRSQTRIASPGFTSRSGSWRLTSLSPDVQIPMTFGKREPDSFPEKIEERRDSRRSEGVAVGGGLRRYAGASISLPACRVADRSWRPRSGSCTRAALGALPGTPPPVGTREKGTVTFSACDSPGPKRGQSHSLLSLLGSSRLDFHRAALRLETQEEDRSPIGRFDLDRRGEGDSLFVARRCPWYGSVSG